MWKGCSSILAIGWSSVLSYELHKISLFGPQFGSKLFAEDVAVNEWYEFALINDLPATSGSLGPCLEIKVIFPFSRRWRGPLKYFPSSFVLSKKAIVDSCGSTALACFWGGSMTIYDLPIESNDRHCDHCEQGQCQHDLMTAQTLKNSLVAPLIRDLCILDTSRIGQCASSQQGQLVHARDHCLDSVPRHSFSKEAVHSSEFYSLSPQSFCDTVFLKECLIMGEVEVAIEVLYMLSKFLTTTSTAVEEFLEGCELIIFHENSPQAAITNVFLISQF